MTRLFHSILFMTFAAGCQAQELRGGADRGIPARGIADVEIIDRDDGTSLRPHLYRGEYWVAGRPGARYAIEIRNRLGERLLAVTSVDGVNAVSGATAGWDQVGYVLGAGQRYQITGWRKSDAEVAAFTFADSADSYAERTGRPANVGIIGVALFRERQPEPIMVQAPALRERATGTAPVPPALDSSVGAETDAMTAHARRSAPAASPAPVSKLGTAHGNREYSHVDQTEFVRLQNEPNQVVRIHYDTLEHLFAMGIIRRPRPQPTTLDPFPATPANHYVPDPPA